MGECLWHLYGKTLLYLLGHVGGNISCICHMAPSGLTQAHPSQAWHSPSQLGSALFSSACPGLPSSAELRLIRIDSAPLGGQP